MTSDKDFFRHKHLWIYHKYWDFDGDGTLSWDDFNLMAEKYAVYQRKGKWDDEVVENWRKVAKKWWDSLYAKADLNQDSRIDIDEWMSFFEDFSKSKHTVSDIPEFLSGFLQLFFVSLDYNKDGLFCVEDYKSYLNNYNMDLDKAQEHYQTLLNEEDKAKEGGKLTQDRFNELVLDFLCSHDPQSKGRYICGPYDSLTLEDLESKCKHLSSK